MGTGTFSNGGNPMPTPEKPMTLQVSITADNQVFIGSEPVAETMSAARRAGLSKIGFVTQPE